MKRMPAGVLILSLCAIACERSNQSQVGTELTPAQRSAIADTVGKLINDFFAVGEQVDADKAAAFFSPRPDFSAALENGAVSTSSESFLKDVREGWKGLRSQRINMGDSRIAVLSPTVAVATISATASAVDTAGKKISIPKAAFTLVWIRESGGWKVLSFHQSFPPPTSS